MKFPSKGGASFSRMHCSNSFILLAYTDQAIGESSQAVGNVLAASSELATNASELEVQVDKVLQSLRAT